MIVNIRAEGEPTFKDWKKVIKWLIDKKNILYKYFVSRIFKMANIGRLTLLLPFSRQKIYKKSVKNEGFQFGLTQVVLIKNSRNKK